MNELRGGGGSLKDVTYIMTSGLFLSAAGAGLSCSSFVHGYGTSQYARRARAGQLGLLSDLWHR